MNQHPPPPFFCILNSNFTPQHPHLITVRLTSLFSSVAKLKPPQPLPRTTTDGLLFWDAVAPLVLSARRKKEKGVLIIINL